MQVGDTGRDIQSVLLTTDVTVAVVNEAISLGCQLIISHHPLLFHGLKQICGQTPQARVVEKAVRHEIAVYSAHTSLDSVWGGINTRLADKLGVRDYHILVPSTANPSVGLGVIGSLPEPMPYEAFLRLVRDTLGATYVRYTSLPDRDGTGQRLVQRIALCGGSGAEFIGDAIAQGADVYLTADCKYHEMQDADGRIGLVDIDHWISERHAREIFKDMLSPAGVKCYISQADTTPVNIL